MTASQKISSTFCTIALQIGACVRLAGRWFAEATQSCTNRPRWVMLEQMCDVCCFLHIGHCVLVIQLSALVSMCAAVVGVHVYVLLFKANALMGYINVL